MAAQPSPSISSISNTHRQPVTHPDDRSAVEVVPSEPVSIPLRLFEICASSIALIAAAPMMLLIAILIRLESKGPVIFVSQRVGAGGKPFPFYKFRTMYADARQRFPELYAYKFDESEQQTMKFKIDDDPRITRLGKRLRATSLDELPNFWCVLKGDMALVGPRPEIPQMLPYYQGKMLQKFSVRPGITGMAQVSGRGDLLFLETVAFDLEYVRRRSFWLDLRLLARTVSAVLTARGAV
jgi:lipopolysaccharide/colanic/teichoic acid biosynthesis glycosyltransferase